MFMWAIETINEYIRKFHGIDLPSNKQSDPMIIKSRTSRNKTSDIDFFNIRNSFSVYELK